MPCPECKLEVAPDAVECPHCGADLRPAAPAVRVRRRRPLRTVLGAYGFLLPNIIGFLAFTLLPVFAALALSFFNWDVIQPFFPEDEQGARAKVEAVLHERGDHARFVGVDNYEEFLGWERDERTGRLEPRDRHFWKYMYNTVFLLAGIPVGMVLSLLLALLMNQKLKGIVVYRTIYFLPSICVPAAVALLWMWLLDQDFGLLNSLIVPIGNRLGLWLDDSPAWIASPEWSKPALILVGLWVGIGGYNCILYLAGLQGIPAELYEAAEIDGAGWWHRLRHITWPMLSPTTFFIFVMSIIAGFQGGFTYIHMMTRGGPAGSTTTIIYYIYQHAFQWFKMGRACGLAMILFVIVFVITLINWRYGRRAVHYQ